MARAKLLIDETKVEPLAAAGFTLEEIADSLGISRTSLFRRRKEMNQLEHAIKKGRIEAHAKVSNALFQLAISGDLGAIVWYEKTRRGLSGKAASSDNELIVTIKREVEGSSYPDEVSIDDELKRLERLMRDDTEPGKD